MDALDGIPKCVLGYQVKTRSQIVLSFMVPVIFEFIVYVVVMTADILVVVEHFRNDNNTWAWLTLCLIWIPTIASFSTVLSSPSHWPETIGCDGLTGRFVGKHLLLLLLFPVAAIYRFSRRFFWCVEALFHDRASHSRLQAVYKIRETSPCELYHFLQAFLQSGPQMFLQLYILLRDNAFRNYDTVTAQIMSIVFSFLTMASIIATYQRFESQKIVGRCYPWSSEDQVKTRKRHLIRTTSTAESLLVRNSEVVTPESNPITPSIMKNFYSKYGEGTSTQQNITFIDQKAQNDEYANVTDDDKLTSSDTVDSPSPTVSFKQDLIENIDEIQEYVRRTDDFKLTTVEQQQEQQQDPIVVETFDQSPRTPAPPTPTAYLLKRASMLKNMFVFDAQSFIKDHVPRLPEGMFEQDEKKTPDVIDGDLVSLPSRKQTINGLEEDDLVGKAISFAGWVMFLLMRMISLSVFYVFFPTIFWMVCLNHYLLMIACIIYEVRFHEKLERYFFYLFLAYIYVYSLLEFKIRFIHVRTWYIGYFVIVFAENIVMSALWYNLGVFESWWFDFLHFITITSGILSLLCLLFYYGFLRPKDKLLFVN
ncbi:uncharacterized protein LOC129779120 [Toxorhynchites rutilus septentrionalis]|uniref:uncharacterized protein LOC129779120 n=1 Tax=Toxorhynchites rutilus septentrionalis TaxID=329112 RepID=UPI002479C50D|nr:uncharacterized protein LOC129779120 [Toxorhynchites rutilus septentrionalis]